jgi:hypothetical protein
VNDLFARHFPLVFPLFFVTLWLAVSITLGWVSGWFGLAAAYPDHDEPATLHLVGQSGTMGSWVGMHGILRLSVCPSGLRIGMLRLFGPFSRDFLVPWNEIAVSRRTRLAWSFAELQFGNPSIGMLRISDRLADRLASAAAGRWPEPGPFPGATRHTSLRPLLLQWALLTGGAALFFTVAPRLMSRSGSHIPVLVTILLPAIFFGIGMIVRHFVETR